MHQLVRLFALSLLRINVTHVNNAKGKKDAKGAGMADSLCLPGKRAIGDPSPSSHHFARKDGERRDRRWWLLRGEDLGEKYHISRVAYVLGLHQQQEASKARRGGMAGRSQQGPLPWRGQATAREALGHRSVGGWTQGTRLRARLSWGQSNPGPSSRCPVSQAT